MQAVPTIYCATPDVAVIFNAPIGRRMTWLHVQKQNSTGQQEETN
jgi:hypothetical protein